MKKSIFFLSLTILCMAGQTSFAQIIQGKYAIKNVKTGLLLRPEEARGANGTTIVGYSPVNWKCMTWNFLHVEGETYQLKNLFTSKTLQPENNPANGTKLEQQPLQAGVATQEYDFIPVSEGKYRIRLKGTDLYLTPSDLTGTVNAAIILAKKREAPEQLWTIYAQNPTQ
jgi:Ricin-type beta-trefoil lectin domain-like